MWLIYTDYCKSLNNKAMLMRSEFFKLPKGWLIQYDIMFSGKRWGKKVEEETLGMMVPVFKGALFSWTWLNTGLPMKSGEWILCFVLFCLCAQFFLYLLNWFYFNNQVLSLLAIQFSLPFHWGIWTTVPWGLATLLV